MARIIASETRLFVWLQWLCRGSNFGLKGLHGTATLILAVIIFSQRQSPSELSWNVVVNRACTYVYRPCIHFNVHCQSGATWQGAHLSLRLKSTKVRICFFKGLVSSGEWFWYITDQKIWIMRWRRRKECLVCRATRSLGARRETQYLSLLRGSLLDAHMRMRHAWTD